MFVFIERVAQNGAVVKFALCNLQSRVQIPGQFNFCFIAFLKRSILLEFKPMRELLEYQDIFVMQVSSTGVIQDMTQNM